jgi:hypothetical protein
MSTSNDGARYGEREMSVIYSAWERCAGPPYFGKFHCQTTAYFAVVQSFIVNELKSEIDST